MLLRKFCNKLTIYIYLFTICIHIITCSAPYALSLSGRESECEANRSKLCQGLYNETRVPNTPHRTQDDNIMDLQQYERLIMTSCSKNVRLFLCSFFIPMCTILEEDIMPCRSLCEEVKNGCEEFLQKYVGLDWPHQLRCEQFSKITDKKLCIGNPNPKTEDDMRKVEVQPNKKRRVDDKSRIVLHCPQHKHVISFKKMIHETSNCLRSASQEAIRKLCNGEKTCKFTLKDITNKLGQLATCKSGAVGPSGIKYTCVKEHINVKQLTLNYGDDESLYCKSNSRHIVIKRVQFKDKTCVSPNAYCVVSQLCTGRHNCVLWATENYLKSKCAGGRLKLSLHYECVKTSHNERVETKDLDVPGSSIKLECQGGVISIIRAEYIGYCKNNEIHCAVNFLCHKKSQCTLNKTNLSAVKCIHGQSQVKVRYVCT